jgi:hypothetical protein
MARAKAEGKKPGILNRIAGAIVGGIIGIPVGAVVATVVGVGAMVSSGSLGMAAGALVVGPFIGAAAGLGLGVYDGAKNGLTGLFQSIKDRSRNLANPEVDDPEQSAVNNVTEESRSSLSTTTLHKGMGSKPDVTQTAEVSATATQAKPEKPQDRTEVEPKPEMSNDSENTGGGFRPGG